MATNEQLFEQRYLTNMRRISALTSLVVNGAKTLDPSVRGDLCRAVVVFLHAAFEDMLRTVARERLATAGAKALKDIPLVGTSESGRTDKFTLSALDAHRGKTVDDVI